MTIIKMDVCQCDFCGLKELTLPTCAVCGKHMCVQHRNAVDFGVFSTRERNEKFSSVYKESDTICPECIKDKPVLYVKLAEILLTKSEEVPPEEPLLPKEV